MSARQRVSANAIGALKDALTAAFWFKRDLYAYAKAAVGGDALFLAGIDWLDPEQYKRTSVELFVDRLVHHQDDRQDLLLGILIDVAAMEEFPQLRRVEDSELKIAAATERVAHLRGLVKPYEQALADHQARRGRIAAAQQEAARQRAATMRIDELKTRYLDVTGLAPQQRGFALEPLLREIFGAFDLDPKASFRLTGEQIDGGFTLDGEYYLLEAKWENSPADRAALDVFVAKIDRRSENTLGLFVAIAGFQPTAVTAHTGKRSPVVLFDGGDLYAVLDARIDQRELLRRKRRAAALTGDILLTAGTILGG